MFVGIFRRFEFVGIVRQTQFVGKFRQKLAVGIYQLSDDLLVGKHRQITDDYIPTVSFVGNPLDITSSKVVGKSSEFMRNFRRNFFLRNNPDDHFRRKTVSIRLFRHNTDDFGRRDSPVFL